MTISVDRAPFYRTFLGDISYDLGHLHGIEQFMADMIDNPEWLHGLLQFMSDGILRTHDQAEEAGDWGLTSQHNQAMTYSEEFPNPAANNNCIGEISFGCSWPRRSLRVSPLPCTMNSCSDISSRYWGSSDLWHTAVAGI
ncbi:MAG: hypothetical protein ACYC0V_13230 [Armatimonadota bacterium]